MLCYWSVVELQLLSAPGYMHILALVEIPPASRRIWDFHRLGAAPAACVGRKEGVLPACPAHAVGTQQQTK